MSIAQGIETEIQAGFNQPQNATLKNNVAIVLSGSYGTTGIYKAVYAVVKGTLPASSDPAYVQKVNNFIYSLYISTVQYLYATYSLADTDVALWRSNIFNYVINQFANWAAANPPPGTQFIFAQDLGGVTRLSVFFNSTVTYSPFFVVNVSGIFAPAILPIPFDPQISTIADPSFEW